MRGPCYLCLAPVLPPPGMPLHKGGTPLCGACSLALSYPDAYPDYTPREWVPRPNPRP